MSNKTSRILAMVAITGICIVALHNGIDGQIAYLAIGALAGLAGYEIAKGKNE